MRRKKLFSVACAAVFAVMCVSELRGAEENGFQYVVNGNEAEITK